MKDKKLIIYEMPSVELAKNQKILKKYKTIIKNKLEKPIDLKKLYYEQFDNEIETVLLKDKYGLNNI